MLNYSTLLKFEIEMTSIQEILGFLQTLTLLEQFLNYYEILSTQAIRAGLL